MQHQRKRRKRVRTSEFSLSFFRASFRLFHLSYIFLRRISTLDWVSGRTPLARGTQRQAETQNQTWNKRRNQTQNANLGSSPAIPGAQIQSQSRYVPAYGYTPREYSQGLSQAPGQGQGQPRYVRSNSEWYRYQETSREVGELYEWDGRAVFPGVTRSIDENGEREGRGGRGRRRGERMAMKMRLILSACGI